MLRSPISRRQGDGTLVSRFQRGVRAGFAVTAVLALAMLLLTETISGTMASREHEVELLSEQRADLLRLRGDLAELLELDDLAREADQRVEIAELSSAIAERHVEIVVQNPDLGVAEVEFEGELVPIGEGVALALQSADLLVELHAGPVGALNLRVALLLAFDRIEALDKPLADLIQADADTLSDSAYSLRILGRLLAAITVVLSALRLFVLGRPLVKQLSVEQEQSKQADEIHQVDRLRRDLNARLSEGMETAETEEAVREVVERALGTVVREHPVEMLLADSSMAHLKPVAVNASLPAPGCGVSSPWSCPAVRRASTIRYEDSDSIRACPYLADREDGPCSAICVPVSFIGDAMGVLHVTGDVGWKPPTIQIDALELIAGQTAVRLGTIRSFAQARLQASTDVLTGLPNRRATEDHIGRAIASRERGAIAMADLDKFKVLNDTYGHEAGDRALRMFADVVRESIREQDWVGRWGGEEFVMYLPGMAAAEAGAAIERIRANLAERCERTEGPNVTVSIGVVDTSVAASLDELVAHADNCLYVAKEEGRDRIIVGPVDSASLDSREAEGLESEVLQ